MKKEITDDLAGFSVYNICSSTGLLKDSFVMHNDEIDHSALVSTYFSLFGPSFQKTALSPKE